MASKIVEFVLRVNDRASKIVSKAARGMGKYTQATTRAASANNNFNSTALGFAAATEAITNLNDAISSAVRPGMQFESQMAELSAITGKTGEELNDIGDSARQLAIRFGGSAGEAVESYKAILSRLGPDIADNPAALQRMGEQVQTLSKTMGGDAVGSMDALTTAMLQYNVSLDDPMQATKSMDAAMNIMAASAKVGSAEVPQISQALKVAGSTASQAGVDFSEANAAIQVLAKGALKGSEGGTKLRNVISKLSEGRFLPPGTQQALRSAGVNIEKLGDKSISLNERLSELKSIQNDTALVTKLFGAENANAASILLQNLDTMKDWQKEVTGTNEAQKQANTIMDTTAEQMARLQAFVKDVGISFFNMTGNVLPAIQASSQLLLFITQLRPAYAFLNAAMSRFALRTKLATLWTNLMNGSLLKGVQRTAVWAATMLASGVTAIASFITGLVSATAAQIALNVAMNANPIGLIILSIIALAGIITLIIAKWDVIKQWLIDLAKFVMKWQPMGILIRLTWAALKPFQKTLQSWWNTIVGWFSAIGDWVKKVWGQLMDFLGFSNDGKELKITAEAKKGEKAQQVQDIFGKSGQQQAAAAGGQNTDATAKQQKGVDEVAGGGQKQTNFNITIRKFQDEVNINVAQFEEGVDDFGERLEEEILRVVNGVNQVQTN